MRGENLEKPISHRRLSDISFTIDKNLNVKFGNRSFLVLLHKTDFVDVNLSSIISLSDSRNFKYFLNDFSESNSLGPENFIVKINPGNFDVSCIFEVSKSKNSENLFDVLVEELSFSRNLLDKALLEVREYSALLQNFDAYYFIYDNEHFVLKNTKDFNSLFTGKADEFREFFENSFKLSKKSLESKAQMNSMLENIKSFVAGKYYNFFLTDGKMLSVHTLKTSTRKKSIIVGSINFGKKSSPLPNLYAEERDGLTGLYNKKAMTELAIKKINEKQEPCSMIIIDVDKFKDCNDNFGHIFGDRVLVAVASCINDAIKGIGIAGRIGGDEFLVILDKTEEDDIRNILRNIRAGIQWSITAVEPETVVTCSMGCARFPMNEKNYERLFKLADKCLYIAKNRGRNCYIIYRPEIHDQIMLENERNENKISSGQLYHDAAEMELSILYLLKNKKGDFIKDTLEQLVRYIQVSKISLYDSNLKPLYIAGKDSNDYRADFLKDNNYFSIFNKFGYLHMDNTNVLLSIDEKRYALYVNNKIASTIEVLCKDENGKRKALICYDIYRPAQTFQKDKITFALMVSKLISNCI